MKIKIKGIEETIIIGCYEHEKTQHQLIIADVECELYTYNWLNKDNLETTVNYDELIEFVRELLPKPKYNLLESLSQYITSSVLDKFALIHKVTVDLVKPALSGVLAREIKVSHTQARKFKVALALGSNHTYLPQQQLITAIEILGEYIAEIKIAGFYETKPVGGVKQNNFINSVIVGYTELKPEELLGKIKTIEKLMGKEEIQINGPRIIDIDLIFYDDLIYTHNFLHVPHKDMHNRDFVLVPLADIAPKWVHPVLGKTVEELCAELPAINYSIIAKTEYYKGGI